MIKLRHKNKNNFKNNDHSFTSALAQFPYLCPFAHFKRNWKMLYLYAFDFYYICQTTTPQVTAGFFILLGKELSRESVKVSFLYGKK